MKLLLGCSNISLLSHGIVLNWNAQKKQFNGIFYDWKNIAKNEEKEWMEEERKRSSNVIQYEEKGEKGRQWERMRNEEFYSEKIGTKKNT